MSGTPGLTVIDAITQFVGGTQAAWNSTTIAVPDGIVIYAPDTTVVKVGDGVTLYQDLPVIGTLSSFLSTGGNRPGYAFLEWFQGNIVQNGQVYFVYKTPSSGTIESLDYLTGNGSFVVTVNINDTPIGGLDDVTVNNTTSLNASATSSNTFNAGDKIVAVITNTSGSPTDVVLNINLIWS